MSTSGNIENVVEFTASVVGEPTTDGLAYRAKVTGGPSALEGLFAFGDSPAGARRALSELISDAFKAAGEPLAAGTFIRMTVPEIYRFPVAG